MIPINNIIHATTEEVSPERSSYGTNLLTDKDIKVDIQLHNIALIQHG